MKTIKIHFLGAAGTVTGSKFYLDTPEAKIMVDCGMFQGLKELRKQNWEPLPIDVTKIDSVLLTHGHLDHTGYLPRLVRAGFNGVILGSAPTLAITRIILRDSAKIHEEEAENARREGYSKHSPPLPFYTLEDAEATLQHFQSVERDVWKDLSENIRCRFRSNGHIIGSTFIEIEIFGKRFVFSGDVGRKKDLLLAQPDRPKWADYLFLESTYGDTLHPHEAVDEVLVNLVKEVISQRGTLIIPSFAVERLQSLMYCFWNLYKRNRIPNLPIFIDSPMGNNVLRVFEQFPQWHLVKEQEYSAMIRHFEIISSYADTWKTVDDPRPKVVIAGSGMVTGGRVLTYLKQLLDHETATVLLVGYQAEGTRGRKLLEGARELKIFGKYVPVKARIMHLESLSAHADQGELLHWVSEIKNIPESVFLIHGEPGPLEVFGEKIAGEMGWKVHIPKLNEVISLPISP